MALLHDPLFSLDTPRYLGLGTLGFIVAHEIMHGFDNAGVEFDDQGHRSGLLSNQSQSTFQQKMNCLSNQFSDTFQTEFLHNGNVADLGAVKAIVATQKRLAKEHGQDLNLPGLSYTQEQLMLINAAQAYCAIINPQAYALIIGMDEHTPPHDR